ncbi:TadE/TadG family type IV pilus assembly protein [Cupriavidus basilensis]|uniref:TadE/TadG family type IV pilus assembly protein n=1 Tax=Cupriavidus basilensis TaxID=68895 RepID=UPI0023E8DF12|nr:TadE/TadG family type IV pilus assembly protein [Cupriavidus basilensis]MDF3883909.1 TadE/TadG family type IV pilus assembly protein [Cupriavidus basilensis]
MPTYAKGLKLSHSHSARRMSGAAAVEFALVFPLLLLVVIGAIEFGAALYDQAILTNASREAARFGVMLQSSPPTTKTQVLAQISPVVQNYSQNKLITFGAASQPQVDVTFTNSNTGSPLLVTVSYAYTGLLLGPLIALATGGPAPGAFTTAALTINATTIMKYE